MRGKRLILLAMIGCTATFGVESAGALSFKLTLPKRSELTPVQKLNRQGVEAIRKHDYDKAEAYFYKAYLYDAADPFTLNNLGYISELRGNLKRAQRFYKLASEQGSTATIDLSNAKQLEGKPMEDALTHLKSIPMRVNHLNVEAIGLLSQGQNFEADRLLREALALDPGNPFTLNNIGVAEEATGDFNAALKHYDEAAATHSSEPVVVTLERTWRGKPVSEMAAKSAQRLRTRMQSENSAAEQAAMLSIRGVHAINRNDWTAAKQDFLDAYSADPESAFSINNLGYVAETRGDMETAQFYYSKARRARGSGAAVGLATRSSANGQPLTRVAGENDHLLSQEIEQFSQAAHHETGPIQLIPRHGATLKPSAPTNQPSTPVAPNPAPQAPR